MTTWQYWTNREIPEAIRLCMDTVAFHHADYQLATDDDIAAMGGKEVLSIINGRAAYEKADVIRLWLLWKFGGQWIDSDCISLRPLDWDQLLDQFQLVGFGYAKGSPYFSNAVMAGRKGSPIIKRVLDRNLSLIRQAGAAKVPYGQLGQAALRPAVKDNPAVRRFEHWRIMPIRWTETEHYNHHAEGFDHEASKYWNPNAYLYHLTNKGLNPFRSWNREGLMKTRAFLGFLFRKSFGLVYPLRAREILSRLPRGIPLRGAEIGVDRGMTSRVLLQQRPNLHLTLVDPWSLNEGRTCYRNRGPHQWTKIFQAAKGNVAPFGDRARIIRKDSVRAAAEIEDGSLDLVFIDADHQYPAVVEDMAAWVRKIKPGGLFCGHDYNHPRNFTASDGPQFGVNQAVDEFAALHSFPVELGEDCTWFIRLPNF